ncbi:MAG: penicillin-binding transpeptidase domain-containing protein [Bacteroidota bacterium]|nr:penicillin-binding transpeptidase domain-containing protein [Bacteroidota bacterium]MDP4233976.1 penicillin-binding transpeptidase domain-containing protein [Bacteroidota bacterium]MDP4242773.1 penicillin-binding transpeptidase domain-containing protein [Bacteroidota bacterium]MDP4288487.1 penicillin-binding transpeptidase domain-containing protein [Bacteroidota bacterium]
MKWREQDELPFGEPTLQAPPRAAPPAMFDFRSAQPRTTPAGPSFNGIRTSAELTPEQDLAKLDEPETPLIKRLLATPKPANALTSNGRLYVVLACFMLALFLVIGKLFKLQVLDHDAFSREAAEQYKTVAAIPARRGVIRDRHGMILATNAFVVKYAVDPKSIQHKEQLAALFAEVFGRPAKAYLAAFNDTSRRYIVVEKEVPLEVAARLDSVKDRGLIRMLDSRRNYAFGDRASHVIGFASKDGRGLAGIELLANRDLAGHVGTQIMQKDGHGALRPDVDYDQTPAKDGEDLTLTIDEGIQSATESALKAGVEKAGAEAGIAIVMRPSTGEILALANVPDFDPNHFGNATNDMLRNRAITDAYEPGSTIKVLVASAALEDGAWKPDDKIDAEHGHWAPEKGVRITDTHEYGILTFRQALEKSSNISFAKISDKLDRRRFYKYLRDFGIGNYTGIDLPGEVKGVLHTPASWQANSKRYMAFGYELTATPIQMAVAYATVANYGLMMKPYIIAKRDGPSGSIATQPQEIRRVVSEATCRTLIGLMEGVVDSGTATLAQIKGVRIAGKTGTAQQLVDGHWSKQHYTSSFTGFFPAQKPEYLISVILRSPHNGYYGGTVSGPIFREIAMQIMDMNGTLPAEARTQTRQEKPVVEEGVVDIDGTLLATRSESRQMPNVLGLSVDQGRSLLASQGFVVLGTSSRDAQDGIIDNVEKCGGDTVRFQIVRPNPRQEDRAIVVPTLVGLPMTRAIKYASAKGLRVHANGLGTVLRQEPGPGALLTLEASGSPTVTLFGDEQ